MVISRGFFSHKRAAEPETADICRSSEQFFPLYVRLLFSHRTIGRYRERELSAIDINYDSRQDENGAGLGMFFYFAMFFGVAIV